MNHVFSPTNLRSGGTRHSFQKLTVPSRSKVSGKRALSLIGPTLWNELPMKYVKTGDIFEIKTMKTCSTVNSFKHELNRHYFDLLHAADKDIFVYTK